MAKNIKILVVDDDADTFTWLSYLLIQDGYKVVGAVDGEEALDKVHEQRPDVVLVDIQLPGLDGYDICRQIKGMKGMTTKVIMYTAYVDAVNVAKAREVGADDFIGKTSDFANMRRAIENLLKC